MPSSLRSDEITTTAMPASRSCWRTSFGPIVVSVSTTVGARDRIASALSVWPPCVTTGRFSVPGKVVDESRPTTWSPSPSPKTVAAIVPEMSIGRMRSIEATVTLRSSASTTVVGSTAAV